MSDADVDITSLSDEDAIAQLNRVHADPDQQATGEDQEPDSQHPYAQIGDLA